MKTLSNHRFFELFFTAVYQQGFTFIETITDKRHQAFAECLKHFAESNQTDDFPFLIPSSFTGKYLDLDQALWDHAPIVTQPQMACCQIVSYEFTPPQCLVDELNNLPEAVRNIFTTAAKMFCQIMSS